MLASGPAPLVVSEDDDDDDEEVEDPRQGLRQLIWSVETDQPRAALSFDDGPHPTLTPEILDILDRYGVKATFMPIGYQAWRHPDLVSDIVAAGHELGHHTWSHMNLAKISVAETRNQIEASAKTIEDVAGVAVRWFRPPRGRLSEAAVRLVAGMGQDIVLWSVTRGALADRVPGVVADRVVAATGRGDIIDFHDGIGRGTFKPGSDDAHELMGRRLTELAALPDILERIRERGIQLGTISDLLAVRRPARA
jgi:peptidoglycan/xylan/chitin deacetylase (PgdA/CDA1 family)